MKHPLASPASFLWVLFASGLFVWGLFADEAEAQAPALDALLADFRAVPGFEASFVEARKTVEQARTLRLDAEEIQRTDGRQAANDKFLAARRLYKKALYDTETWIEPELGEFTSKQIEGYLRSYVNERGRWTKENAGIGKVHAD